MGLRWFWLVGLGFDFLSFGFSVGWCGMAFRVWKRLLGLCFGM